MKKILTDSQWGGGHNERENEVLQKLEFEYDWLMLEILDQMVRMESGGQMQQCFSEIQASRDTTHASIIQHRVGEDLLTYTPTHRISFLSKLTLDKLANKCLHLYLKMLYYLTPRSIRSEIFIKTSIGERHKWAYDCFSLTRMLQQCGFQDIDIMQYNTSSIPNFNDYLLDINADSTPYKGVSSIYIEAKSPQK